MRGDRVIATATSYDGPPPGTPGTVEVVDTATGAVEIDFATWGRLRAGLAEAIGRYLQLDYVDVAVQPPGPEPAPAALDREAYRPRSEEHTSELQSLMRISYAVFCLTT